MRLRLARAVLPFWFLCLGGCSQQPPPAVQEPEVEPAHVSGIYPNIKAGDMSPQDAEVVTRWISEAIDLLQSPEFETNFRRAGQLYPELFVSQKEDLVHAATVMARLKTNDPMLPSLWWAESFVSLTGKSAKRTPDRTGFGFEASRIAGAGPIQGNYKDGEIELGRLHLARYMRGDAVEKSCALNTMVHEISHTLSDKPNMFWMHILDSEENVTAPGGVFEASYFIGTIAQCTYLKNVGRIEAPGLQGCMMTFSDPTSGSRFKSLACDDFPGRKPITPKGRLSP